ncbi:hypothetical protein FS837_008896 [Tulasnella sp. UAMH 9824]|nr:hypothetical protein FS837_008896 [Tulasnella sp. UAMH 9824]
MRPTLLVAFASVLLSAVMAHPLDTNGIYPNDSASFPPAAHQAHPLSHPHPHNLHHAALDDSEVEPYPRPHPDDVAREARALKMGNGTNAERFAKGLPPLPPVKSRHKGRVRF